MIDLQKEAENHFGKGTKIHGEIVYPKEYVIKKCIEFATHSKYVQAEKLRAQIAILEGVDGEYYYSRPIYKVIEDLQQQLKTLEQ